MPTIELDGVAIAYREAGEGAPVILLHSSANSGRQWQALAERLAPRHRVFSVDLHGYGESAGWHGRRAFALADEAAVVAALASRLDAPAHIVGHSYGGAVALLSALWLERRAASLALIEPSAFFLLHDGDVADSMLFHEIRAVADKVAAGAECGDEHGAMAGFVDYWNGAGAWQALSPNARSRLAPLARKVTLDFAALFNETTRRAACRTMMAQTLVLRGTRSPAPARRIAEIVAGYVPEAVLREIEGAGHMLPLTHAEAVNARIVAHIASAAAAAPRKARSGLSGTRVSTAAERNSHA